jgi:DNA-binding helix-turn-helix protein
MPWLTEFRKERGYTRNEMAEILGVSVSLYDKIEYGKREPSRNFLVRFKKAFPMFNMNIFFGKELHETCGSEDVMN